MKSLILSHRVYFGGFLAALVFGAVMLALIGQGEELFFFSGYRTTAGDLIFTYLTRMGEELAYVLFVAVLAFVRFRYVLLLPTVGLVVTLVSALTKSLFAHPRPGAFLGNPDWADRIVLVDGIELYSGMTSFPSGHTMSAFALYTVLALCFRRGWATDLFFLLIAVLVGLSRIYLVQHFLKDVVMGAAIGVVIGLLIFYMQKTYIPVRPDRWYDRSLNGPADE